MNVAHLHLLLNHVPTIGTALGLGLLLVSLVARSNDLKQASLAVFFVLALLALPAYLSGNAAEEVIEDLPNVSKALIERHQDAALPSLALMEITGVLAWFGLWQFRRTSRLGRGNLSAVLLLSMVTFGLMTRTATMGGEIRHPEIRSGQETIATDGTASADTEWLATASIASFVINRTWVWPASETLHFIGLCLLFGVALLVNLRMLGMMKSVPFAALHRLLPWGMVGFGINAMTGMLFFIAAPEQYTQNVAFHWKMALILLAGANVLYLTVFDEAWTLGPGDDAPPRARAIASST